MTTKFKLLVGCPTGLLVSDYFKPLLLGYKFQTTVAVLGPNFFTSKFELLVGFAMELLVSNKFRPVLLDYKFQTTVLGAKFQDYLI